MKARRPETSLKTKKDFMNVFEDMMVDDLIEFFSRKANTIFIPSIKGQHWLSPPEPIHCFRLAEKPEYVFIELLLTLCYTV
ncbi:hypothetical protein TcWFU_005793 [Taenia crassiceps]|uniref:Uncharacterized protein n=1 Tax=Taenia crassiceps TaxID=6207 RepID=A0ABR4Q3U9_9CEST